ncbi:MAG: 4-alpha-glucanotransferase [Clostridia bacterium]|nr:4-alpha-glucanotransferase [Clostridia bacterium]
MARQSGILLHISSLPGPDGIGSLGQEAFDFADFLESAGMRIWQVLPMGPTGYGESPYQSSSVYAGNPMLISLQRLRDEGLLTGDESYTPADEGKVDFPAMRAHKEKALRLCYAQSAEKLADEVEAFRQAQPWVEDFALFTALKARYDGAMWTKWPDRDLRFRRPKALQKAREELKDEISYHIFVQALFDRQWRAFKSYCNGKGISLFGDMPIYVAEDSADTWTRPEVFQLDKELVPTHVAGVPPDYFSADGQLWGNPLYRWVYLRYHGYSWWVERMQRMAALYDIIRIDHFIGFANYYSVPYGSPNARTGKWIAGPGGRLFDKLNEALPGLRIVAEDLGCVNAKVRALLRYVGYPGMGVAVFGFGADDANQHLCTNYKENSVVYTGTHDNDTVLGYLKRAPKDELKRAKEVLHFEKIEDGPGAFIRGVLASKADTAVIPMQDVLGLDNSARMNEPSTIGSNWLWRMLPGAASPEQAARLKALNVETRRA